MRGWQSWPLLGGLILLLFWVNLQYFNDHPLPHQSQHRAFRLVPRLIHHFMGFEKGNPRDYLSASHASYAVPQRVPQKYSSPTRLVQAMRPGGTLSPLLGPCGNNFSTCMPHGLALPAFLATRFPEDPRVPGLGTTAYLALLVVAIYAIGTTLADRTAALLAATLAAGMPGLFGYSRHLEGYLPATAISVALVATLFRSRGFTRPGPVLLFGLLAITGMRTGEGLGEAIGVGLAVVGPFVLEALEGWRRRTEPGYAFWKTALGLSIALGLTAWGTDWTWIREGLIHVDEGFAEVEMAARAADALEHPYLDGLVRTGGYLLLVYTQYLKPVLTGWFLVALPLLFWTKVPRRYTLGLWFLIPWLSCTIMSRQALWYALPMVPPLALITALGLSRIETSWLRRSVQLLAGSSALAQLWILSHAGMADRLGIPSALVTPDIDREVSVRKSTLIALPPSDRATLVVARQLVDHLNRRVPKNGALKQVGVIHRWGRDPLHAQRLSYYVTLRRPDIQVVVLAEATYSETVPYFHGLEHDDFILILNIRGQTPQPLFDEKGNFLAPTGVNQGRDPGPYLEFTRALAARVGGPVEGFPGLYWLPHPLVPDHALPHPSGARERVSP